MPLKVIGRVQHVLKPISLRLVFFGRQRPPVTQKQPGHAALRGLNLVAELVSLLIHDMVAVTEIRTGMLDDLDLVLGCLHHKIARSLTQRNRTRLSAPHQR